MDLFKDNILVNDNKQIFECLESADRSKPVIVEIINDNAGFELYTDVILADYLIEKRLASKVRFSVKPIPWYVSDATPADVTWTFDFLCKHTSGRVRELGGKCKQRFDDGTFLISPIHYFWVSPYEYYK